MLLDADLIKLAVGAPSLALAACRNCDGDATQEHVLVV